MLRIAGTLLLLAVPVCAAEQGVVPLKQAHAHNDYEHERPLLDALDHGFCGVEADVFLVKGELLVAHNFVDLKPERTLEALYLKPLAERIQKNGGRVYPNGPTIVLLIDFKSQAEPTYAALDKVLAKYADILSTTKDGKFEEKAVTVVISGNRPKSLESQPIRYAGLDGRVSDVDSTVAANLMPMISDNWRVHFRWSGKGSIPEAEKAKLDDIVAKSHKAGRVVRFWATPENPEVWGVLADAGVDLINTDQLAKLQGFLLRREGRERETKSVGSDSDRGPNETVAKTKMSREHIAKIAIKAIAKQWQVDEQRLLAKVGRDGNDFYVEVYAAGLRPDCSSRFVRVTDSGEVIDEIAILRAKFGAKP